MNALGMLGQYWSLLRTLSNRELKPTEFGYDLSPCHQAQTRVTLWHGVAATRK